MGIDLLQKYITHNIFVGELNITKYLEKCQIEFLELITIFRYLKYDRSWRFDDIPSPILSPYKMYSTIPTQCDQIQMK